MVYYRGDFAENFDDLWKSTVRPLLVEENYRAAASALSDLDACFQLGISSVLGSLADAHCGLSLGTHINLLCQELREDGKPSEDRIASIDAYLAQTNLPGSTHMHLEDPTYKNPPVDFRDLVERIDELNRLRSKFYKD